MSTITIEEQQRIASWLDEHPVLAVGLGNREQACSIAAINLALSGEMTDDIPECMSPTIGKWIIQVQDTMPAEIRNSAEWRGLLPLAAGTGREHEEQRRAVVLDWMWGTVLPSLQGLADERGFGREWRTMTAERTPESALAAREAAREAEWANAAWAAADAARADAAADAAWAAWAAAAWAAWAAADAAAAAWAGFDPCGLLKRLIETGDTEGTNE
ncbi:MAG TPA: hypothetical protein VL043_11785 [Protaetiibacter sp.]|nr:hypothetical protein [Protaetiibacter sp.]